MKTNPRMEDCMTPAPHTINSGVPVKLAKEMMKKYGIRHLPVQVAGKLVGVITDRDLKLSVAFGKEEELMVDDVMTQDPYTVTAGDRLRDVAGAMADHKYGCAVVHDDKGRVTGVFTTADGMRLLSSLLEPKKATPARRAPAPKARPAKKRSRK